MILQWHITNICNLRCRHCYQNRFDDETALSRKRIEHIFTEIDTFRNSRVKTGNIHLALTGGEPFLFPELRTLLNGVADRKEWMTYSILTNGTVVDKEHLEMVEAYPPVYIQVSFDGTRKYHDTLRGAGSFRAALRGLQRIKKRGVRTSVSFTANKENMKSFLWLSVILSLRNVSTIWTDRVIPFVGENGGVEGLTSADFRIYLRILRGARLLNSLLPLTRTRISTHRALQFLSGRGLKPYRCTAGWDLLAIMPDGTVYPCRRMEIVLGNVFETKLVDIYTENKLIRSLERSETPVTGCMQCRWLKQCHGGLKCLSFATFGTPFKKDPCCPTGD
jgi:radical SAM protein with 4Fe4S-binding SPASM domain